MELTVRRIESTEALPLREIRLAALADSPGAFITTHAEAVHQSMAFWADRVATNSTGDQAATFIADTDGTWVGMVAGYRAEPDRPVIELVSMWVNPAGRGTGVGRALVAAVIRWAEEIGIPSVELWVMTENQHAVDFYQTCGFGIVGAHEAAADDPCANEIRMVRHVTSA